MRRALAACAAAAALGWTVSGPLAAAPQEPPDPAESALVSNLLAALDMEDPGHRAVAAEVLGDHAGEAARQGAAGPLLRLAQKDPALEVREAALWTLGDLGPDARDTALPALWDLVEGRTAQPGRVQGIAAWAAARMEPTAEEAAPRLIPLTIHYDDFTRSAAIDAVGVVGAPLLPYLLLALATQEGGHAQAGLVEAIGAIGEPAAPALPLLQDLWATTSSSTVRLAAERAIGQLGAPVPEADQDIRIAELTATLESGPDYAQRVAIRALGALGAAAGGAVPALRSALREPELAATALEALLAILPLAEHGALVAAEGPALLAAEGWTATEIARTLASTGEPARAVLDAGLRHSSSTVRGNALVGLAALPPDRSAYRRLESLLADDAGSVRVAAAQVLVGHGPRALPALERAILAETDPVVRAELIASLGPLGPAAIPVLRGELGHPDRNVVEAAARAAAALGPDAAPLVPDLLAAGARGGALSYAADALEPIGQAAVPALLAAVAGRGPGAADAALALARIGPPAEQAVPILARALDDSDAEVRQWAAFALGRLGPAAAPAIEDLRAALTDPEPWVRQNAAEALGAIGPAAAASVPDLIAVVERDPSQFVAENAASALGRFGPAATDAVEPLARALTRTDSRYLQAAAARALLALGRTDPFVRQQLRAALADPCARVRWAAADALLVLGEPADLVPALLVARRAPDEAWQEDLEGMRQLQLDLAPPSDGGPDD